MPDIVIFLGAGVSKATFELPSMIDLYQDFSAYLRNAGREYRDHNFFYEELLEIIESKTPKFEKIEIDVETVLTVLTDLGNYYIKERFNHPTILYLLKRDRLEKRFESLFADTQKMYANVVLSFKRKGFIN